MKKFFLVIAPVVIYFIVTSIGGSPKAGASNAKLAGVNNTLQGYRWRELTNNAAFSKSYNFQLFTIRDTVWAFHPAGNWYSADGMNWTKSILPNAINNLAFLDYVYFNDAVYGLGHFEGNIEKYRLSTEIYKTTDLKSWTVIATESNLPRRFFYHPFVFKNKLWIVGGCDDTGNNADIWNSEDAITWKKVADDLPFGKRANSQFVLLNNKIYLLNNDVWSSADGITWKLETKEIVKGQDIFGYAAIAFDNKIWLLGCNRNNVFKSELLVSDDGRTWTAQSAPWSPRGGMAACVFNNKIIATGGKYGGPGIAGQTEFVYSNDVWELERVK